MYPPDTVDLAEHEESIAENARDVLRAFPALVKAFGGTPEVARVCVDVLAEHPAIA